MTISSDSGGAKFHSTGADYEFDRAKSPQIIKAASQKLRQLQADKPQDEAVNRVVDEFTARATKYIEHFGELEKAHSKNGEKVHLVWLQTNPDKKGAPCFEHYELGPAFLEFMDLERFQDLTERATKGHYAIVKNDEIVLPPRLEQQLKKEGKLPLDFEVSFVESSHITEPEGAAANADNTFKKIHPSSSNGEKATVQETRKTVKFTAKKITVMDDAHVQKTQKLSQELFTTIQQLKQAQMSSSPPLIGGQRLFTQFKPETETETKVTGDQKDKGKDKKVSNKKSSWVMGQVSGKNDRVQNEEKVVRMSQTIAKTNQTIVEHSIAKETTQQEVDDKPVNANDTATPAGDGKKGAGKVTTQTGRVIHDTTKSTAKTTSTSATKDKDQEAKTSAEKERDKNLLFLGAGAACVSMGILALLLAPVTGGLSLGLLLGVGAIAAGGGGLGIGVGVSGLLKGASGDVDASASTSSSSNSAGKFSELMKQKSSLETKKNELSETHGRVVDERKKVEDLLQNRVRAGADPDEDDACIKYNEKLDDIVAHEIIAEVDLEKVDKELDKVNKNIAEFQKGEAAAKNGEETPISGDGETPSPAKTGETAHPDNPQILLNKHIEENNTMISSLSDTLQAQKGKLGILEAKVQEGKTIRPGVISRLKGCIDANEACLKKCEAIHTQQLELQKTLTALTPTIAAIDTHKKLIESESEELKAVHAEMNEIGQLEHSLAALKDRQLKTPNQAGLPEEIQDIRQQLTAKNEKLPALQKKATELTGKIAGSHEQLKKCKEEVSPVANKAIAELEARQKEAADLEASATTPEAKAEFNLIAQQLEHAANAAKKELEQL